MQQNDMAGLVTFDDRIRHYIPPRGSRAHLRQILRALGTVTPGPATDVARVCHDLAETIKARGMVILISDMLDDTPGAGVDEAIHALRHFQHKKHDVIVFHVLSAARRGLRREPPAGMPSDQYRLQARTHLGAHRKRVDGVSAFSSAEVAVR